MGLTLERISDRPGHADSMTRIYARFMPAGEYDAPFIERGRAAVHAGNERRWQVKRSVRSGRPCVVRPRS